MGRPKKAKPEDVVCYVCHATTSTTAKNPWICSNCSKVVKDKIAEAVKQYNLS